jgi:oligopeptide/dipeptide ABC transporter ATP-binding protein
VEPDLIVCDEPVSALDVSVQANIVNLLRDLQRDTGVALVFISHDLAVVRHLADDVAVMYAGRVVEASPAAAMFAQPVHPYTRALLDAAPRTDAGARRHTSIAGEPPNPTALPQGCRFAPRCPHAQPICESGAHPPLVSVAADRLSACLLDASLPAAAVPGVVPASGRVTERLAAYRRARHAAFEGAGALPIA